MRGLWGALALLALAGAAAAQVPEEGVLPTRLEVAILPPAEPIRPLGPFAPLPVEVRYTYLEAVPPGEPTRVSLSLVASPPWAVVTIAPATVYLAAGGTPCGCERTATAESMLLVSVTAEAPAFAADTVTIAARAAPNGAHEGAAANGTVQVEAGFLSLLEMTGEDSLQLAGGEERAFPVTVANLGNARTLVTFGAPEVAGAAIEPPSPANLGSRQAGEADNSAEAAWLVRNVGLDAPVEVRLTARGWLASDPSFEGDEETLIVRLVPASLLDGPALALPGPAPLLALGGLALLALARPRRRGGP